MTELIKVGFISLILVLASCGKESSTPIGDLVATTQITDASMGYASHPQYKASLYPPVSNPNNYEVDIDYLDLYYYSIAPKNQKKALIVFGDSRMVLFTGDYQFPVTVYSFARGGSTSTGVLNRLTNLKNFRKPEDPDIGGVFIQVGINDVVGTNMSFNRTDFKSNYIQIANYLTLNFPNVPVTIGDIITLNNTSNPELDYDTIDDYNGFLKTLCQQYGFTFIQMNPLMAMPDRSLNPLYDSDGIHFSHAGFDLIYNQIMPGYLNLLGV